MTRRVALSLLVLALASGCEHERNWLFDGEWIDIDGWDREADEACGGTFEYLDDYSGMLAAEFGVEEPLGIFRWSSMAHYTAGDLPCRPGMTCAAPGEAYSTALPDEHEVVHLANYMTGMCPSVLAEGLAVYYGGMRGNGSALGDFELLSACLTEPDATLSPNEYPIAGRFVAFLVHEFGLPAVLEVCSNTGRHPDAAALSSAMEDILGASPAELVGQLAGEPDECNELSRYSARLYACGDNPLAPDAGVVGPQPSPDFVATYSFSCANEASIGSVDDEFRFIQQIEFAEADLYHISIDDSDGNLLTSPPITMMLAKCGYCGEVVQFRADVGRTFELDAGRYWLELRAPADVADKVELTIRHHAG